MKYLDVKGGGQKAIRGAPDNKALSGAPEDKGGEPIVGVDALEGVHFTGAAAKKKADEAGLTAASFKRKRSSSDKGFTVTDVERIAATADEG